MVLLQEGVSCGHGLRENKNGIRIMKNTEIAIALFKAFAQGNAEAVKDLCNPNMTARQNNNEPMDLVSLLEFSAAVNRIVSDFEYANPKRSETETGFVEEHDVRGRLPDGTSVDVAICVVCDVEEGKVIALREYFDPTGAADLIEALDAG